MDVRLLFSGLWEINDTGLVLIDTWIGKLCTCKVDSVLVESKGDMVRKRNMDSLKTIWGEINIVCVIVS